MDDSTTTKKGDTEIKNDKDKQRYDDTRPPLLNEWDG